MQDGWCVDSKHFFIVTIHMYLVSTYRMDFAVWGKRTATDPYSFNAWLNLSQSHKRSVKWPHLGTSLESVWLWQEDGRDCKECATENKRMRQDNTIKVPVSSSYCCSQGNCILYQFKALSFSCSDVYADYHSPQSTETLFCDLQILYTQNCILPLQQKLLYII
jgi:hypothetical protein